MVNLVAETFNDKVFTYCQRQSNSPWSNDKGRNSNFAVEKLSMYDCKQKSLLVWPVRMNNIMFPMWYTEKWHPELTYRHWQVTSGIFLPKRQSLNSFTGGTRPIQTNGLPRPQGLEGQRRLKNCFRVREMKEIWVLYETCDPKLGPGPGEKNNCQRWWYT